MTSAPAGAFGLAVWTLVRREVVRFARQRSRVVGAFGQPLLLWLLLGSALGASFRPGGAEEGPGYLEYLYPGFLALILLFASIFATITLVEDRAQGFLQGVLVAPAGSGALVTGKVLGGACLALLQALVFLVLAPLAGLPLSVVSLLLLVPLLLAVAFGLTALGFLLAWRCDTTMAYHALMSVLLLPMWLLSGAVFPPEGTPIWLRSLVAANPLTYGVAAIRRAFYLEFQGPLHGLAVPAFAPAVAVVAAFGLVAWTAARLMARTRTAADLL